MITRAELKANAKSSLKGNWGTAVLVTLIFTVIMGLAGFILGIIPVLGLILPILFSLFVSPALSLGLYSYFMKVARNEVGSVNDLFSKFGLWLKGFVLVFLIGLFTWLWSLLLIIPGIIASYRYSQAFYILLDNPELSPLEAINKSKEMMNGHKMEFFVLQLSFIGWAILAAIPFAIGYLWLMPYVAVTYVNFYKELLNIHKSLPKAEN